MTPDEPLEPDEGNPTMGFRVDKLHDAKVSELAVRFAFGAGISLVAAVAGIVFSPKVGGMFLAFPAILPATLTLLEDKHGTEDAVHDVRGSEFGAIGLVAFAIVAAALFTRTAATVALAAATAAWILVSIALYLVIVLWRHAKPRAGV